MADEEDIDVSKPKEPPKPVHIGGESLADRVLPHMKKILISVVVVAVILSGVFGFRAYRQSRQSNATEKIAKVLQVADRKVTPGAGSDTASQDFPDLKSRAAAVLDSIAKNDADVSHAYKGGLLLDAGRTDEAITTYRRGVGSDGIDGVLAREGLGIALETKALAEKDTAARQKLLEEALATFTTMQPKKDGSRYAYALYHQGRVQQVLGKTVEAKALFEQARDAGKDLSELAQQIEIRLGALGAS